MHNQLCTIVSLLGEIAHEIKEGKKESSPHTPFKEIPYPNPNGKGKGQGQDARACEASRQGQGQVGFRQMGGRNAALLAQPESDDAAFRGLKCYGRKKFDFFRKPCKTGVWALSLAPFSFVCASQIAKSGRSEDRGADVERRECGTVAQSLCGGGRLYRPGT